MSNNVSKAYTAIRDLSKQGYVDLKTDLARVPVSIAAAAAGTYGTAEALKYAKDALVAAPDAFAKAKAVSTELGAVQIGLSSAKVAGGVIGGALLGAVTVAHADGAIRSFGACANACA